MIRLLLLTLLFAESVFAGQGMGPGPGLAVSSGASTACVGFSNDDTSCSASLDANSQYSLSGSDTTVCRNWSATTAGTVSKITVSFSSYTSSTEAAAVWYIGTSRQAYKTFTPSAGEVEIDMSTGATGTLTFSNSDDVYICLAVDGLTGGIERDDPAGSGENNYFYDTGSYMPSTISLSENTSRELALRLEYTY